MTAGPLRPGAGLADRAPEPRIRIRHVTKSFGPVSALADVNLDVAPGSVHALIGENGAGKSTLGKIISGVLKPDEGEMVVDGMAVTFRSPREALDSGIATIEQEVSLVPRLSVQDNVLLGVEPRRLGFVRRRALTRQFRSVLATSGFPLAPGDQAGQLPLGAQQQVEILRSLSRQARLVVMDEPSAALNDTETQALHRAIRQLAAAGTSVLLVSHFLKEVLSLADTVTVLRDGRLVKTGAAAGETENSLIVAMLGRPLTKVFPRSADGRLASPRPYRGETLWRMACAAYPSTSSRARSSAWQAWSAQGALSWPGPCSAAPVCAAGRCRSGARLSAGRARAPLSAGA